MDVLSLSSSLSISKPISLLSVSHSNKQKSPSSSRMQFSVSCRATKLPGHENYYKILSLSPNSATMDDIKRAYRSMALRYHPDVCHECHDRLKKEESTRMFVKVNAAYKTLSNPRLRAEYDYELGLRMRSKMGVGEKRWEEQVVELKRRSQRRMAQKGGTWGSTMRAQNTKDNN
ncbi:DnaJ domain containing protein [Sesbania bispinosa]|nr:DnaJ domain containing protein [Sesbania bispinosa]